MAVVRLPGVPSTSLIGDLARDGSTRTHFMRFAIDAVSLDRGLRAVDLPSELGPWRMARKREAKTLLELRAGEAGRRGGGIGDRLSVAFRGEERDG